MSRRLLYVAVVSFLLMMPAMLSAQYTYGVTGLLHTPTAEMQKDKTVMLGANYLNKELTPPTWSYDTYNYYLNVTIFPFLEVAYTCTLFKAETLGITKYGYSGFTNQDRYFSFRIRALKEGQFWKYMPAVVVGTSDPFTSSGSVINTEGGNGYFSRFYGAATKHIEIGREEIGVTLSYLYNRRRDYPMKGLAGGLAYKPSFLPDMRVIAEYDTRDVSVGATYLFFNHLQALVELQDMKHLSGGLTFKFCLSGGKGKKCGKDEK